MKIYNNKDNKDNNSVPKRSCSYCSNPQHVVTECPQAPLDWAYFQRFEIPIKQADHWTKNGMINWNGTKVDHWYRYAQNWSRWFADCEKAVEKINEAKVREAQKSYAKNKGRRTSKCGFCGATDHNRRDCQEMKDFKTRLLKANQSWRRRFYNKAVVEMGISVGAIIKVNLHEGNYSNRTRVEKTGIIMSINTDEISMFCARVGCTRWEFQQDLKITVRVDGQSRTLSFSDRADSYAYNSILKDDRGILSKQHCGYDPAYYVDTIARSETQIGEEWIKEGREDSLDWLVGKYSLEKLKEWGVETMLEKIEKADK